MVAAIDNRAGFRRSKYLAKAEYIGANHTAHPSFSLAILRRTICGRRIGEVARHLEVSPKLLERWRGEWQARGELAFPGVGKRGLSPALTELQRIAELERKIGQLTMENDFLKKRWSISGIITRQPSSVARLPV